MKSESKHPFFQMHFDVKRDFKEIAEAARDDYNEIKQSLPSTTQIQESISKTINTNHVKDAVKNINIEQITKQAEIMSLDMFKNVEKYGKEFISSFVDDEKSIQLEQYPFHPLQ